MERTYENFKRENRLTLFGHEDAGKENEDRLSSYYYKTVQYEDIMSNIGLQIVTGEKGTGKSALLRMAYLDSNKKDIVPLWIRLDDLSELYGDILKEEELYRLKTLWKQSISRLVVMKLASEASIYASDDYNKALDWAYRTGYASRDFITLAADILKPIYGKYIDSVNHSGENSGEFRMLGRMINHKKLRLFFDDFDLDWKGNSQDILKIKSLLLSLGDMTSDIDGLSARIALRTDVYEMIRTEEFSDKFESAVIKCKWNNQEIVKALAKRISAYFQIPFDEENTNNPRTMMYQLKEYLDCIFEPNFGDKVRIWKNAPTYRVIYSLIRRKPRDMVKLCNSVSEEAYNRKINRIDANCFVSVLENYSQERMRDLINEYSRQMPKLQDLLVRMAPTQQEIKGKAAERYVYTTDQLFDKIKNIQQNINIKIYTPAEEGLKNADFHQIAHFLYKIGFITGRKRVERRIARVYFDESPYLLNANTGDGGYAWEIHPAYRGALARGINDEWESTLDVNDEED